MREIKFRAWMQYWDSDKKAISHKMIDWDRIFNECDMADLLSANYKFMQFTGLKDKNGKEIYEGDIIHMIENFFGRIVVFNAVIEYQPAAFWFRGLDYNCTDCNWHHFNAEDREVIGNIYENPELLK
jgi:uncharacterized phage protein (TIGR01671 family)